ncbi:hypothetical protein GCM10009549_39800 [Streptomyces thermoalcalitolerans]|uniref:Ribbon-helix-helix protein CopG domain-containing protein n=1 Tax=Streptomyces thermoalcalitolerans TaxID=65605 RepID=A0ABN1P0U8_9ACTN
MLHRCDLRIFTCKYLSGTVWGMPALNVEFSDRELEDLRQIAKERGTSMKALVREAAAADIARHRALQEGAEAFRKFFTTHADEFAEAFPEDESPSKGEGRAA